MADEIVIGKLILDTGDLEASMASGKRAIIELENEQKKLKKDTDGLTTANEQQLQSFIDNETELKKMKAEYAANQKSVLELTKAQTGLDAALSKAVKTEKEAIANTAALKAARQQLDGTTVDGAKAIAEINTKIDSNNKLLLANGSANEKAATITGNYRQKIFELGGAFGENARTIIGFGKGLDNVKDITSSVVNSFGNVTDKVVGFNTASKKQAEQMLETNKTFGGAAQASEGLAGSADKAGKASGGMGSALSMIGKIGIILVLTLIVAAIQKLYSSFAPVKDAIDGLIAGFKSLGESIMSVVKFLSVGDFSKAGDAIGDMGENAKNAASAAMALNSAVRELDASTARLAVTTAQYAGKEKELQLVFENSTLAMDTRSAAMGEVLSLQKAQLKSTADLAKQEFSIEQKKLGIALNGRKLTKALLADDLEVAEQFNALQKKKATLYSSEQEIRLFNLQKNRKISDANVKIADDEFKIVTGSIKKQVELLDTKLQKEGITSKEIRSIVSQEQALKMQALGEYDKLFKKVSGNKIGASTLFDEKGFVRIGINMFDLAKKFQLSANQADRLRDMLGEYKDIDDRLIKGSKLASDTVKKEQEGQLALRKKQLENTKLVFESEVNGVAEKLKFYADYYDKLNKLEGGSNRIANAQALSSTILALTEEQINAELEAQKVANEKSKAQTVEQFAAQRQSAEDLATAQLLLLDKKLLSEKAVADETIRINTAKNDAILLIDTAAAEAKKVADEAAAIEAKALQDVAFQIRLQDIVDKNAAEQEIKQALLAEQYAQELALLDQSLADKAISEGVYLQKKVLAEKKFSSETKKNDKVLAAQKQANNVQMINDSIGALQAIFGESKALAVASALMNTYEGITAGVKLGYPMAIPAVLFAAATGFAAVKNILKTNKGSTSMDTSAARPVTTSGTGSFVNTAQTETVARVSDTPQQQQPIVTPPVLILESLHEAQNNLAIKVGSS